MSYIELDFVKKFYRNVAFCINNLKFKKNEANNTLHK